MRLRHRLVLLVMLSTTLAATPPTPDAEASSHGIVVRRDAAETFAVLPDGVRFPEGIAADPDSGDIFVGTFDFGPNPNRLLRYDRRGRLEARKDFGATPLLGLEFNRADSKVYVGNFGLSRIQRIRASFTATTTVEDVATIPSIGAPAPRAEGNPDGSTDTISFGSNGFPAPNAMTFTKAGDLFVSDSFQGAIFRIRNAATCVTPCAVETVKHDGLLATAGFPPFGANGLALSRDESALFVANTGDDRVLRLNLATGELVVFAESLNGADGIAFDRDGRLWVAANQADEIVGLDEAGRPIARLGDFKGISRHGTPRGLLFPASPVIVKDTLFVTNLAIALTAAVGDEPEEDVTRWTISKIHLPGNHEHDGDHDE
jgi:sugar lactone lactonase YvrE